MRGKTRWSLSLGTANRTEAAKKARALAVEHDQIIEAARRPNPLDSLSVEQRDKLQDAGGVEAFVRWLDERASEAGHLDSQIATMRAWVTPETPPPELAGDPFYQAGHQMEIAVPPDPDWLSSKVPALAAESQEIRNHIAREAPLVRQIAPTLAERSR